MLSFFSTTILTSQCLFCYRILCETVKDFISKISDVTLMQGDDDFSEKCQLLKSKLNHLLQVLQEEQKQVDSALAAVYL